MILNKRSVLSALVVALQAVTFVAAAFDDPDTQIGDNSCNIGTTMKMRDFKKFPWLTDIEARDNIAIKLNLAAGATAYPECSRVNHSPKFHRRPGGNDEVLVIFCSDYDDIYCCRTSISKGVLDTKQSNDHTKTYTMTPCV